MKAKELRELEVQELEVKGRELRDQLWNARVKKSTGQLENTALLRTQTASRLRALDATGHPTGKIELLVLGGTRLGMNLSRVPPGPPLPSPATTRQSRSVIDGGLPSSETVGFRLPAKRGLDTDASM